MVVYYAVRTIGQTGAVRRTIGGDERRLLAFESASNPVTSTFNEVRDARVDDDPATRSNVEREFQTPAQRLSKRQFDEETKRMMGQLTSRIAGSMSASQPKNGLLASAAEHLSIGGGRKGSGIGGGGGGANAAVNKAGPIAYSHNNTYSPLYL